MFFFCRKAFFIVLAAVACGLLLHAPTTFAGERIRPSVLDIFKLLPTTIFENTPEGMNDEQKQQLLANGRTNSWRLDPVDTDEMRMVSVPVSGSTVTIRLFHSPTATAVVVGADSGDGCAVELWKYDEKGRLLPYDLPADPTIKEFFTAGKKIPAQINPSMQLCFSGSVLRFFPLFWDDKGPVVLIPDNAIFYRWGGGSFEKVTMPLSAIQAGTPPPATPSTAPAPQ